MNFILLESIVVFRFESINYHLDNYGYSSNYFTSHVLVVHYFTSTFHNFINNYFLNRNGWVVCYFMLMVGNFYLRAISCDKDSCLHNGSIYTGCCFYIWKSIVQLSVFYGKNYSVVGKKFRYNEELLFSNQATLS